MIDAERLISDCRAALAAADALARLSPIVAAAVADAAAIVAALPDGEAALRATTLCNDAALTLLVFACPRGFVFPPHDHRMPSVVGVAAGIEDNVYYARRGNGLVELGRRRVRAGEVVAHEPDVIHAIANGGDEPLVALHVYGGDFLQAPRSEWRGVPAAEQPYDLERLRQLTTRR